MAESELTLGGPLVAPGVRPGPPAVVRLCSQLRSQRQAAPLFLQEPSGTWHWGSSSLQVHLGQWRTLACGLLGHRPCLLTVRPARPDCRVGGLSCHCAHLGRFPLIVGGEGMSKGESKRLLNGHGVDAQGQGLPVLFAPRMSSQHLKLSPGVLIKAVSIFTDPKRARQMPRLLK